MIGLAADIMSLTGFNILEYIKKYSPYSYLWLGIIVIVVYFYLVLKSYLGTRTKFSGAESFDYSRNNGILTIGTEEYTFDTQWGKASNVSIYAYSDASSIDKIGYKRERYAYPAIHELEEYFENTSRSFTVHKEEFVVWRNKWGKYAVTRVKTIKDDTKGDTEDQLSIDYKIYR